MKEKLQTLYNTLLLIETKGESTKIMADCLRFTEKMIREAETENQSHDEKVNGGLAK